MNKWEFAVAYPRSGSSSAVSRSDWNLEMLVFVESGKPEKSTKNASEKGLEPTTNSTNVWRQLRDTKPGHKWEEASTLITAPSLLPVDLVIWHIE